MLSGSFLFKYRKSSLNERAASIAFNLLVAIPPALSFFLHLFLICRSKNSCLSCMDLIRDIIPGKQNYQPIIDFLEDFISNEQVAASFLLVFYWPLYFSSNAMIGIMRSFNKLNYIGFSQRHIVHDRWVAIKLTLILFLIILCLLLL